ncbi:MAG: glyoxalase/bleomycin resistance protein/dioxygenase [Osedax symbiont Rs2]|nr:MAG: glyoxalase/bleomycin resistance protein/dioxygenase [Osedax symbiont Rs2]
MVRLEHANLVVKDIQPTLDFLLAALPHWRVRGRGQGAWANTVRNWVHVGDDDYYICLNDGADGTIRNLKGLSPGLAHLGFVIDDLTDLIERLTGRGFEIDIVGRDHPFRSTVYYCDPAGFQFEFMQYHSSLASEKNQYGGESGELTINRD